MKKLLLLFPALISAAPLFAQDKPDLQTSAYRDGIGQAQIQTQSEEVRQKLIELLDDIQQNQMKTADFSEAQKAAANLQNLNETQLAPLIASLKQAGNQQATADLEARLVAASQAQKTIQLNLKTMADSLELHKDQAALITRLEQLALRQTANLRQSKTLAGMGAEGGRTPPYMGPVIDITQGEQSNIANEIALAIDTLQKVVDMMPADQRGAFADALADAQRLNIGTLAGMAADQMAARTFTVASVTQKQVLDGLEGMVLKLKMSQALADRLEAMSEKLQEAAADQKNLADKAPTADAQTQKDMSQKQGQLSDRVSVLQKELAGLNVNVLQQTNKAMTSMDAANATLDKPMDPAARQSVAQNQNDAAAQLQKASDALQDQIKSLAQVTPQSPLDAANALNKIDQQVQQAEANQKAQAANPAADAAQEQQQAQQAANMQQQALPVNQPAAQALGDAAAKMQQNSPADAADALAQADAALQQQMQALSKAAATQQALQALSDQVAAAKQQTDQAGQDLNNQAQQDMTPAVKQTQDAQQTLGQAQQQANQAADDVPSDVKKDLDGAAQDLASSANSAVQSKKGDAAGANASADKKLGDAMKAIGDALAAAKAGGPMPGQPMPGGTPMPGQGMAKSNEPSPSGMGFEGQDMAPGGFMSSSGPKGGPGEAVGQLNPKDRAAISLLQKEKAPPEYQTMVQQYLKNLADGAMPASPSTN